MIAIVKFERHSFLFLSLCVYIQKLGKIGHPYLLYSRWLMLEKDMKERKGDFC